ncbi:hypothetical protein H4W34_002682 [Actinomadura algeriensis]|uniref:Uncharacterized protein n=1 Tax=Actinomadura algeriensis TaxID=1679523 RepID=A0ABR9JQK0_9ACTN|nr:hypothetical protein [Actinomadura algeriensis]
MGRTNVLDAVADDLALQIATGRLRDRLFS